MSTTQEHNIKQHNDARQHLDSVEMGYLRELERILGQEASEVRCGYEGEPLHFRWVPTNPHRSWTDYFEVEFMDDDRLDVRFMYTSDRCHTDYEESIHIPLGRTPPAMVRAMKQYRNDQRVRSEAYYACERFRLELHDIAIQSIGTKVRIEAAQTKASIPLDKCSDEERKELLALSARLEAQIAAYERQEREEADEE